VLVPPRALAGLCQHLALMLAGELGELVHEDLCLS
jgi:hypothetical protein